MNAEKICSLHTHYLSMYFNKLSDLNLSNYFQHLREKDGKYKFRNILHTKNIKDLCYEG